MVEQVVLRGYGELAQTMGVSRDTAKRIVERYDMPCVRICGKVTIAQETLIAWLEGLGRMVLEERKKAGGEKVQDRYVEVMSRNAAGAREEMKRRRALSRNVNKPAVR